jgi:hypothetical protein
MNMVMHSQLRWEQSYYFPAMCIFVYVYSIVVYGCWALLETHIKRQVTQHDCLPSLLGDGGRWIEILYSEERNILYLAD